MPEMNSDDFRRVLTILMDVWDKAGERAVAQGLTGSDVTRAQEGTLTAFMARIDEIRRAGQ
jgi:hypothetical protein